MDIIRARKFKTALMFLAFAAIAVNISMFRRGNSTSAKTTDHGPKQATGRKTQSAVYKNYDLGGEIPGDPKQTIDQMQYLYSLIGIYQKRHGGAYPTYPASINLAHDSIDNPEAYGFKNSRQANIALRNPDMKYADSAQRSSDPESYEPYCMISARPDGTPAGSPKPIGTRDVLAYTEMYYHRNIRYLKGDHTTSKPSGFYLVLWDDGQVEQVPWGKAKFLGPQGSYPFPVVFDGQAGLPKTGVHTYDEYQKWKHDNL